MGGGESKEEKEEAKEINKNEAREDSSGFHIIELNSTELGNGIPLIWIILLASAVGFLLWMKKTGRLCKKKNRSDNVEMAMMNGTTTGARRRDTGTMTEDERCNFPGCNFERNGMDRITIRQGTEILRKNTETMENIITVVNEMWESQIRRELEMKRFLEEEKQRKAVVNRQLAYIGPDYSDPDRFWEPREPRETRESRPRAGKEKRRNTQRSYEEEDEEEPGPTAQHLLNARKD